MFYDKIKKLRLQVPIPATTIVLQMQNVADLYYSSQQDEWDMHDDIPIAVPPWPVTWCEWSMPHIVQPGNRPFPYGGVKAGALLSAQKIEKDGWGVAITTFIDTAVPNYFLGQMIARLKEEDGSVDRGTPPHWLIPTTSFTEEYRPMIRDMAQTMIAVPAMLAMSMCHCKNTVLETHELPMRVQAAHQKRGHSPTAKWYTLQIMPMQRILRETQQRAGGSLQKALHICRGHFKDYREGGGLFGKEHGLYWWEMHVRGSERAGVVAKDYRVEGKGQ